MPESLPPRGLFLIPTDYEDLVRKGVANMALDREENGFLERVATIHPWAKQTRTVDISPIQKIYEFNEWVCPFFSRFRFFRAFIHIAHFARLVLQLVQIVDREKINFIRATDTVHTGLLAILVHYFRPIPVCVSIHADYEQRYKLDPLGGEGTIFGSRQIFVWIEHFVLSRMDMILPIRASLGKKAMSNGADPASVRIIPHGIDLTPFTHPSTSEIRRALKIPDSIRILSFAGRLSKENYVADIVELAVQLRKIRSDFIFIVVGDGAERENLENLISKEELGSYVLLTGFKPREFVISLRKESDISLCLMGGYSLIEACAGGRPVMAYDVEWHSELVKTKETGWLVQEHDISGLLEGICFLLDHSIEAKLYGENGRKLAFEHHDIRLTSALKCRYYSELLTGTKK